MVKFFSNPRNVAHLRGLAEEFGESTNAIRKELNHLSEAGLLLKVNDKNKIDYQANYNHPYFESLKDLTRKYLGFDKLVDTVLDRMGEVEEITLLGDYSRGLDSGNLEVVIKGSNVSEEYLDRLTVRLKELIGKEVNFHVNESICEEQDSLVIYKK
ncbi:MAG: ArsR family transcriptional regulator [Mongoliitalea sp.]